MPLRNTRLIHKNFEARHRPVADGQMTAECVITRPSSTPTALDDASGTYAYPDPTVVYPTTGAGRCRLQRVTDTGQPVSPVAERDTPLQEYLLMLPADAPEVYVHDVVTMTVSPQNPDVVGKTLVVTATDTGSITWQRTLRCILQQPAAR